NNTLTERGLRRGGYVASALPLSRRPPLSAPRVTDALMDNLLKALRFAFRSVRKQPSFTITAIATLALAIGAATAIFSVVESTLLRPLPFRTPARLAFLWGVAGTQRAIRGGSIIEVQDW